MTDRDDLPAPNPPQATTDQLRRELGLLQMEMDRRLVSAATLTDEKVKGTAGRVDKSTEALTGQIDVLRQRLGCPAHAHPPSTSFRESVRLRAPSSSCRITQ